MKTLTTEQIKTLKGFVWTNCGVDNSLKRISNLDFDTFTDLTGYDIKSLTDSIFLPISNRIDYLKSSVYNNGEKHLLYYCVFVNGVEWASGNFAMYNNDVLELFTPSEDVNA